MVAERVVCRSVIRVRLIIAGMLSEKGADCHAGFVHGELLIEMADNVYCKSNDRLFSVIAFLHARACHYPPSIKLLTHSPDIHNLSKGENLLENYL